ARPTLPLAARELARPQWPEVEQNVGVGGQRQGIERTFAAIASLRTLESSGLPASGQRSFAFGARLVEQRDALISLAASDKLGRSNLDRMRAGLAPLASCGLPLRLTASAGAPSAFVEAPSASESDLGSLLRTPSKAGDGDADRKWMSAYWRARAEGFAPSGTET
ncbi:MAG: hypothetical protein JNK04_21280, partial [Myxococcales bacterium]|nr:hypothetical protein [Myxococcales bacterium]